MEKEEAKKILEEQFNILAENNKKCEPEIIAQNIKVMMDIYIILFPCQFY